MIAIPPNHRPSLFWRTFLLLCSLIFFSVVGWLQSFRVLSELPYSQGVAQHIVSTANLTRYALVTADPLYRKDLLTVLAAREELLISPRENTDRVRPLPNDGFNSLIEQLVKANLGQSTVLAAEVNGIKGLWVSVDIDGDAYWLQTSDELLDPPYGTSWVWWAVAACLASLFGATLLARHVIKPLEALSAASKQLGQGQVPDPLPENSGTAEFRRSTSASTAWCRICAAWTRTGSFSLRGSRMTFARRSRVCASRWNLRTSRRNRATPW